MSNLKKLEEVADQLDAFGSAETFEERRTALVELSKKRVFTMAKDDQRLKAGIEYLADMATDSQDAEERLIAVALLSRLASVKSLLKWIAEILSSALSIPLPALITLNDPDDRYYVASALHHADHAWIFKYAASGVVREKQGKKAREELVSVLFERAEVLEDVFQILVPELKKFKPETKNIADSVAKHIENILSAIRPKAISVLIDPGNDVGNVLQQMLRAAFTGAGSPESQEVAVKTIEEIAGLLHDIARTQISLVTEPSLYSAIDVPKSWFSAPEWSYMAEKSPNLQLLSRDVKSALTLLAKQGVTDIDLFAQMIKICGSRQAATKIAREIVKQHPEFDTDTATWLRAGGKSKSGSTLGAMEESQELSSDSLIANLMVDSNQLRELLTGISEDAQTELRLIEPDIANIVTTLVARCRAVTNDVDALTAKRDLTSRGIIGDIVEYSQIIHELIGGHLQGVRKVKIVQPMIERKNAQGAIVVLRKALVEKT